MSESKHALHGRQHQPGRPDELFDLRLFYVEPIAPAAVPDDYIASDPLYSAWEGTWGNISDDRPATGYHRALGGKLRFQIAATGDEGTPSSLMFTLPEVFWPKVIRRMFVVCGADASGIGAVDVYPDGSDDFPGGSVVFVNQITSF